MNMEIINIITRVWTLITIPKFVFEWIRNKYFPYNLQISTQFLCPYNEKEGLPIYTINIKNIGHNNLPPCWVRLNCYDDDKTWNVIPMLIYNNKLDNGLKLNEEWGFGIYMFDKDFITNEALVFYNPLSVFIINLFEFKLDGKWYLEVIQKNSSDIIYKNQIVGSKIFSIFKYMWDIKNEKLPTTSNKNIMFNYSREKYLINYIKNIIPNYLKLWKSSFNT